MDKRGSLKVRQLRTIEFLMRKMVYIEGQIARVKEGGLPDEEEPDDLRTQDINPG